jgi:hypothetical protein
MSEEFTNNRGRRIEVGGRLAHEFVRYCAERLELVVHPEDLVMESLADDDPMHGIVLPGYPSTTLMAAMWEPRGRAVRIDLGIPGEPIYMDIPDVHPSARITVPVHVQWPSQPFWTEPHWSDLPRPAPAVTEIETALAGWDEDTRTWVYRPVGRIET